MRAEYRIFLTQVLLSDGYGLMGGLQEEIPVPLGPDLTRSTSADGHTPTSAPSSGNCHTGSIPTGSEALRLTPVTVQQVHILVF